MTLTYIIQTMTDQRCKLYTARGKWFPLWMLLSVRQVNAKYTITNSPY